MLYPAVGIIAEYNPFHNGHARHMETTRGLCRSKAVVVALSSNFVQRGEPAVTDKWNRAKCALENGADLVVELPAVFSAHNSRVFANAAVDILASCGVTEISFGAESPNALSDEIVYILQEEPEPFKQSLKNFLAKGLSFAQAQAQAADALLPGSAEVMRQSNNILALSYMRRIREKNYNIKPVAVKRTGSAHGDAKRGECPSSAAIRAALFRGEEPFSMPRSSREILEEAIKEGRACLSRGAFWKIVRAALIREEPESIAEYGEISEGLEYKMKEAARFAQDFDEWTRLCASKRYAAGRIRRAAVHLLLGLDRWTNRAAQRLSAPYIRVLGMNATGRELLRGIKDNTTLPVVTTCGRGARVGCYAEQIAKFEARACELWEELVPNGRAGAERKRKIIIV